MNLSSLLINSAKLGISYSANKRVIPYFMLYTGWLGIISPIASPIIPFFGIIELIGGSIFFVIMLSYLTSNNKLEWRPTGGSVLAKRTLILIATSLITFFATAIGLLLFIVPGIVVWKEFIYSGLLAAKSHGPLQALKASRKLSVENGYTLLAGTLILTIPVILLADTSIALEPLAVKFLDLTPRQIIPFQMFSGLVGAWIFSVTMNHMLVLSYKEAEGSTLVAQHP